MTTPGEQLDAALAAMQKATARANAAAERAEAVLNAAPSQTAPEPPGDVTTDPEPPDVGDPDRPGYRTHATTNYDGWLIAEGRTFTGAPDEGTRCDRSKVLYLNCRFANNGSGVWAEPHHDKPRLTDVHFVGCTFEGNFRGNFRKDSHGGFIRRIDGVLFEGCVFKRNGWTGEGTRPKHGRNHDLYFSDCNDVTVRRCVFEDALYHSLKFRNDTYLSTNLYVESNAFIGTPAPVSFGINQADKPGGIIYRHVRVWGNVFARIEAWPPVGDWRATRHIEINNAADAWVTKNLFCEGQAPGFEEAVHVHPSGPAEDILVASNVSELGLGRPLYTNRNGQKFVQDDRLALGENVTRDPSGQTWANYTGDRADADALVKHYGGAG
jgi:hypothetical protein